MVKSRTCLTAITLICAAAGEGRAATFTTLYQFAGPPDGANPTASLIEVGGKLYGTTFSGGSILSPVGTVFKIDPATGAEIGGYSFTGGADGGEPRASLINVGGKLYGTTPIGGTSGVGTVFQINRTTMAESVVYSFANGFDGTGPGASLLDVGGTLYGTTSGGGSNYGTVFTINLAAGTESVFYRFNPNTGHPDGENPAAPLI